MCSRYCINASLDVLQRQSKIEEIFTLSDTELIGRARAVQQQKDMKGMIKEQRAKTLTEKMSQLRIGQEDVREVSALKIEVEERLV